MTLQEALSLGTKRLEQEHIEEAAIDAWFLLEFVTGMKRSVYYLDPDRQLLPEQINQYKTHIETRATHVPLQHITGVQEFMGLVFEVNENVLIPRQDTELLVETVLESMKEYDKADPFVLDMCTGSGCVIISILANRNAYGTGVDISKEALEVAKRNASHNQVNLTLVESNLFEKVTGGFDMIVSNPPYIKTKQIEMLQAEVKLHDPFLALDGKEDGLFFYRHIIEESILYLHTKGQLFFEIGHDQGEEVAALMEAAGFTEINIKKDLAGLDRVVWGRYSQRTRRNSNV
ncbi:MAG: peptide chain release factor N(5)-glutamine methyltransferase [Lachnospiraceae bacterium]